MAKINWTREYLDAKKNDSKGIKQAKAIARVLDKSDHKSIVKVWRLI